MSATSAGIVAIDPETTIARRAISVSASNARTQTTTTTMSRIPNRMRARPI